MTNEKPPRLPHALLHFSVDERERPFLLADLEEEFQVRVRSSSLKEARAWYRSQALRSTVPSVLRRLRPSRKNGKASGRAGRFSGVTHDVMYSLRRLRTTPIYSLVVLLTIALGLSALTSVFSVVDAVLIQSLPFPESENLVQVRELDRERGGAISRVSPPNFLEWRDRSSEFAQVAAISEGDFVVRGENSSVRVAGASVSSNFLGMLGVPAGQGRSFTRDDEVVGSERVVIVSRGFWVRRFGDAPFEADRSIVLNDASHRIVGVLPSDFRYIAPMEVWAPLHFAASDRQEAMRGARYLSVLGRVTSGLSLEVASQRFDDLALLMQDHPNNRGWGISLAPLRELIVGDVRSALLLLTGAVVLILLIVCANIATLVVSRATGALREVALRSALGASRWRILRQIVVEHSILAIAGAGLGVLIASLSLESILQLIPEPLPNHAQISVRAGTVVLAMCIAVATAFVLSAASMIVVTRMSPSGFLRGAATAGQSRTVQAIRSGLITMEVALSIVLLIGAALLVQSFAKLRSVDLGFSPANVLTTHLSLAPGKYAAANDKVTFADDLIANITAQSGVGLTALTTNLPMSGSTMSFGYSLEGEANGSERLTAQYHAVSREYFAAVGIPFRFGSTFGSDGGATPVVVINETLARRHWGDQNPIGRRLTVVSQNGPISREIVGVIADVRHTDPTSQATDEVYVPFMQDPWSFFALVVKADGAVPSTVVAEHIRQQIALEDPALPPANITAFDTVVASWRAPLRFQMLLTGLFALMALCLAAIGIYGVIAYFVGTRVREIGVRIAVGAASGDILGLVVLRSLGVASIGVVVGVALSLLATRGLQSLLFEVSPQDWGTYFVISVVMLIVAAGASFLPARRASRIDPVEALRVS